RYDFTHCHPQSGSGQCARPDHSSAQWSVDRPMTGSWRTSVTIVGALCSHYRYHPWQSLFLLVGLVAGVALWSAVQLVNAEAIASYDSANRISEARIVWRIEGEIGHGVPVDA